MNPVRKRRLLLFSVSLSGLTLVILLILYALRQNINLFFTPEQLILGKAPLHHTLRIGGMVVPGSIHRDSQGLNVYFKITDYKQSVDVVYRGVLPDLFREGQGVVALGTFNPVLKRFQAHEVLAKHDEKYMPPDVKQALTAQSHDMDVSE